MHSQPVSSPVAGHRRRDELRSGRDRSSLDFIGTRSGLGARPLLGDDHGPQHQCDEHTRSSRSDVLRHRNHDRLRTDLGDKSSWQHPFPDANARARRGPAIATYEACKPGPSDVLQTWAGEQVDAAVDSVGASIFGQIVFRMTGECSGTCGRWAEVHNLSPFQPCLMVQ